MSDAVVIGQWSVRWPSGPIDCTRRHTDIAPPPLSARTDHHADRCWKRLVGETDRGRLVVAYRNWGWCQDPSRRCRYAPRTTDLASLFKPIKCM